MTMDSPAAILETKKKTAMYGEYQSGCNFDGAIRNKAPRDDWCSVESITPRIVRIRVSFTASLRAFLSPSHSKGTGRNSRKSTVR